MRCVTNIELSVTNFFVTNGVTPVLTNTYTYSFIYKDKVIRYIFEFSRRKGLISISQFTTNLMLTDRCNQHDYD